jgi:hypothetical protein
VKKSSKTDKELNKKERTQTEKEKIVWKKWEKRKKEL